MAPEVTTESPTTSRLPPGPRPPDTFPPTTGRPGWCTAEPFEELGGGKGERVGQQDQGLRSNPSVSGHPAKCHESSARRVAPSCTGARGPTQPAHRLMAGVASTSRPMPDHRLRRGTHDGQGLEHRRHGGGDVLQRPGMGPGGGHDHQVRALPESLQHGARHLPGGGRGHRMFGQRAGERHDG